MANTNEDQLSQTGRSYYKIGDNGNWWEGYDGSSWIDTGNKVNVPGPIYIQGIQGPQGPPGPSVSGPPGDSGAPGTNGVDGVSPINLVINSSNGYQFKNNIINTTFTALLYQNNEEIDHDGTKFTYVWSKTNSDGTVDTAWNLAHQTSQKSITITNSDVWKRATFNCTAEPLN